MIAHVSGIPVEELVPLALAGGTSGPLVVRVWRGCGFALE